MLKFLNGIGKLDLWSIILFLTLCSGVKSPNSGQKTNHNVHNVTFFVHSTMQDNRISLNDLKVILKESKDIISL